MAKNKKLGMGLDLLLTATEANEIAPRAELSPGWAREIIDQALQLDAEGSFLEAYYLYRTIIDNEQEVVLLQKQDESLLLSQALNNAAIILYEHGNRQQAYTYLEKAVILDPDNNIARSNLDQLKDR